MSVGVRGSSIPNGRLVLLMAELGEALSVFLALFIAVD